MTCSPSWSVKKLSVTLLLYFTTNSHGSKFSYNPFEILANKDKNLSENYAKFDKRNW
jgi:hypothetical protein